MTSSGKIRIYELSKDLSLDNKDVLDAARKLAIAAKSHSSSISSLEANKIKDFLTKNNGVKTSNKSNKKLDKEIVSLKKNLPKIQKTQKSELKQKPPAQSANSPSNLNVPLKPNQNLVKSKELIVSNDKKQINTPSKPSKPLAPKPRKELNPIISKPLTRTQNETSRTDNKTNPKFNNQSKSVGSAKKQINQTQPINRQEPNRPLAPPSRPQINTQKPKTRFNSGDIPSQKGGQGNLQKVKNQNKQNPPSRSPQPPTKRNTVELVGAPIRREKPINQPQTNEVRNKPLIPSSPGAPKPPVSANRQGLSNRPASNNRVGGGPNRPGSPNRQGPNRGGVANRPIQGQNRPGPNNRTGGPVRAGSPNRSGVPNRPGGPSRTNNRPGVPSGMRKPVAPSELMQLQKPQARPNAPQ